MEYENLRVYTSLQQICLESQNNDFPTEGILVENGSHYFKFKYIQVDDSFEFTFLTDEEKEKVMCNAELDR